MVPEAKRNDAAVKAAQAAIELAEQARSVGPLAELEQKVAANPPDHQARFDLAVALNAAGKRADAASSSSTSSGATASGTTTARARSSCSSSRPGARPTKPRSKAASGCRRFCFPSRDRADQGAGTSRRRCRSMRIIAGRATFPTSFRCFRCRARCCCRAARCRSTSSSRAISRWSTTRCATAIA